MLGVTYSDNIIRCNVAQYDYNIIWQCYEMKYYCNTTKYLTNIPQSLCKIMSYIILRNGSRRTTVLLRRLDVFPFWNPQNSACWGWPHRVALYRRANRARFCFGKMRGRTCFWSSDFSEALTFVFVACDTIQLCGMPSNPSTALLWGPPGDPVGPNAAFRPAKSTGCGHTPTMAEFQPQRHSS